MLVKKLVPVDLDITEITLLSIEEYETAETNIPPVDDSWWLRSPCLNSFGAACVVPLRSVGVYSISVYYGDIGVRPAIRFNPRSVNLQIREKVRLGGFIWTHVAKGILLCDEIICKMPFRKNRLADDANSYESSDVKRYLKELYQSWKENEK